MGTNQVQPQVRMGLSAVLRRLGDKHVNDDCAYALGQAYFLDAEMTQDEIIEMVGMAFGRWPIDMNLNDIETFAKLVAAHERKKFCALLRQFHDSISLASDPSTIKARGEA